MRYKHIFFDLDHTLWDFDRNAKVALAELYEQLELATKGIHNFEDFFTQYLHHNALLWDRYHKGFITGEELKWKRMWRTLLDFKIGDETLAKRMSATFLELLPEKPYLFEYTLEILNYLRNKGYKMHLITNGFEVTQWRKLRSSKLDSYFEEVITSEKSNSVKPNRAIFEFALQLTGATVPESIMIGDNLDADIQGAINIGMDSIFVNHIGNPDPHIPSTHIIHHLRELETIL